MIWLDDVHELFAKPGSGKNIQMMGKECVLQGRLQINYETALRNVGNDAMQWY